MHGVLSIWFFVSLYLILDKLTGNDTTINFNVENRQTPVPSMTICPFESNMILTHENVSMFMESKEFPVYISDFVGHNFNNETHLLDLNSTWDEVWQSNCIKNHFSMTEALYCIPCITFNAPKSISFSKVHVSNIDTYPKAGIILDKRFCLRVLLLLFQKIFIST